MKGGRKNLKRATETEHVSLQEGQTIMQVVSLRGSNLIEVVLLWLMKVERKRLLNQVARSHALFRRFFSMNKPEIFKSTIINDSKASLHTNTSQRENGIDSSDDDGLPPLQANANRIKPIEIQSDSESDSCSDTDS
ncbi:Nucleic acid-binding, OB-fold [Quillaja saponaria]|uniref:Nucleic acid-binding, OB-fold n=1 Tax=Quillaja saponaria TaxID=32244 RepID=A0AAD7LVP9_QUISA|nr:Nucleic acid-binding, OB-fold [Quillaja saponaria]